MNEIVNTVPEVEETSKSVRVSKNWIIQKCRKDSKIVQVVKRNIPHGKPIDIGQLKSKIKNFKLKDNYFSAQLKNANQLRAKE